MAKPNKYQWDELKDELSTAWGLVFLECDGYLVLAKVTKLKQRLVITVYVDGWIGSENIKIFKDDELDAMNDIQKKFMHHKISGRSVKEIKQWEKAFGKKRCKEKGVYKKNVITMPYFNTPGAFLAKIKKTCDNIAIIDFEQHKEKLAQKREAANA